MAKKTLGLSQIVKNESKVITRMLNSIKDIVDYVTIVDTGSTDDTIEIIKKWGEENNIPCDVYERPFDNFENSRNYAMEMAKDKTDYSFWLDADEIMLIDKTKFDKNNLNKDIYMFNTNIGTMRYTRNELWNNKVDFRWYGPVHEFIIPKDPNMNGKLTSEVCAGIEIQVHMDGFSWSEDVSTKYRNHAQKLEEYIDNVDRNPRWVFYTAQSYHDASSIKDNEMENRERMRRAIHYYRERLGYSEGHYEERFYSQFRIATLLDRLGEPWYKVKEEALKAYNIDPIRGEPLKFIIEHYQRNGDWNMSYLYSTMAVNTYHNKNPYPNRLLFIDQTVYTWRFLELHANSCFYANRKDEATKYYKKLYEVYSNPKNSMYFTQDDKKRIESNKNFFM